jgi:hypothetical protein
MVLSDYDIRVIKRMLDEAFRRRQYSYDKERSIAVDKPLDKGFPSMASVSYMRVYDVQDFLDELGQ